MLKSFQNIFEYDEFISSIKGILWNNYYFCIYVSFFPKK